MDNIAADIENIVYSQNPNPIVNDNFTADAPRARLYGDYNAFSLWYTILTSDN